MKFLPLFSFILVTLFMSCGTNRTESAGMDTVAMDSIDVQAALTADGPELETNDEPVSNGNSDADMLNAADEGTIRDLLKKGARANSGLLYACQSHNKTLVNDLITAGADLGVALFWAVEFEDLEITKTLIERGARMEGSVLEEMRYLVYDMNREDLKDRWTEVGGCSKVAYSENKELQALVVKSIKGKMYSEVWEDGESPGRANSELIQAAAKGQAAAVEFMLNAGANPNSFTPYCNSALGEAEKNGHTEVVELLKKYEATKQDGC
jgi:hypothetical protein